MARNRKLYRIGPYGERYAVHPLVAFILKLFGRVK